MILWDLFPFLEIECVLGLQGGKNKKVASYVMFYIFDENVTPSCNPFQKVTPEDVYGYCMAGLLMNH